MRSNLKEPLIDQRDQNNAQEAQARMSDQELCKELAGRYEKIKNNVEATSNPNRRMISVGLAIGHGLVAATCVAATAVSAGASAPIMLPLVVWNGAFAANAAREARRPELACKRIAYALLIDDLGLRTGVLRMIPGTEKNKEFKMLKELIKIGKGEEGHDITKIDPAFVEKVKDGLARLRERDENYTMGYEDVRTISQQQDASVVNNPMLAATATSSSATTPSATAENPSLVNRDPNRSSLRDGAR